MEIPTGFIRAIPVQTQGRWGPRLGGDLTDTEDHTGMLRLVVHVSSFGAISDKKSGDEEDPIRVRGEVTPGSDTRTVEPKEGCVLAGRGTVVKSRGVSARSVGGSQDRGSTLRLV